MAAILEPALAAKLAANFNPTVAVVKENAFVNKSLLKLSIARLD
ncbi:MAG: hypothetical protein V7K26_23190 [Nostoc sp.]